MVATLSEEFVYHNHKLMASGNAITAETIANLAEDRGLSQGQYFIVVIGIPVDFVPGEDFTEEYATMFGIAYDY